MGKEKFNRSEPHVNIGTIGNSEQVSHSVITETISATELAVRQLLRHDLRNEDENEIIKLIKGQHRILISNHDKARKFEKECKRLKELVESQAEDIEMYIEVLAGKNKAAIKTANPEIEKLKEALKACLGELNYKAYETPAFFYKFHEPLKGYEQLISELEEKIAKSVGIPTELLGAK